MKWHPYPSNTPPRDVPLWITFCEPGASLHPLACGEACWSGEKFVDDFGDIPARLVVAFIVLPGPFEGAAT